MLVSDMIGVGVVGPQFLGWIKNEQFPKRALFRGWALFRGNTVLDKFCILTLFILVHFIVKYSIYSITVYLTGTSKYENNICPEKIRFSSGFPVVEILIHSVPTTNHLGLERKKEPVVLRPINYFSIGANEKPSYKDDPQYEQDPGPLNLSAEAASASESRISAAQSSIEDGSGEKSPKDFMFVKPSVSQIDEFFEYHPQVPLGSVPFSVEKAFTKKNTSRYSTGKTLVDFSKFNPGSVLQLMPSILQLSNCL